MEKVFQEQETYYDMAVNMDIIEKKVVHGLVIMEKRIGQGRENVKEILKTKSRNIR